MLELRFLLGHPYLAMGAQVGALLELLLVSCVIEVATKDRYWHYQYYSLSSELNQFIYRVLLSQLFLVSSDL
jgi:hypothetical protein